jgi:uncharacterized protein (TIGR02145 family)
MSKTVSKFVLAAGLALAMVFTFSCSGYDGNEGGNSFSYCFINEQCLDGPFTSKECGDLGGLPSNSCNGGGRLSSGSIQPLSSSGVGDNPSSSSGDDVPELSSSSDGDVVPSSSSDAAPVGPVLYGGQTYRTVRIGTQIWFAENLNYAGEDPDNPIGRCYGDKPDNCTIYGRLYDWATAVGFPSSCNESSCLSQIQSKHKGICPSGWHIPSEGDWETLMDYVGGYETAGTKLKAESGWEDYGGQSSNGTDQYGFSALPGGGGYSDNNFINVGLFGDWWSASEIDSNYAYYRYMGFNLESTIWIYLDGKSYLRSVRCLQD